VGFGDKRCNAEADVVRRPLIRVLIEGLSTLRFPGFERADFPVALPLLAGFSLQPGLRVTHDEACQKIPARPPVRSVSGCDRGHGAARARAWILPRHAGVLLPPAENCTGSRARVSEVGVRRELDYFLRPRWRSDRTRAFGLVAKQRIELARQAAAATAQSQRKGRGCSDTPP